MKIQLRKTRDNLYWNKNENLSVSLNKHEKDMWGDRMKPSAVEKNVILSFWLIIVDWNLKITRLFRFFKYLIFSWNESNFSKASIYKIIIEISGKESCIYVIRASQKNLPFMLDFMHPFLLIDRNLFPQYHRLIIFQELFTEVNSLC